MASKLLRVLSSLTQGSQSSRPVSVASALSDAGDTPMEDGTNSANESVLQLSHSRTSSVGGDRKPQNELRALASLASQCALSLIEVADELKPVPYIGPLVECLTLVFRAVERTRVNKEQWKLLQGRCVMVLRIGGAQVMNNGHQHYPGLVEAARELENTLDEITKRVEHYNQMKDTFTLLKHQTISEEIERFFGKLDYCLRLFSVAPTSPRLNGSDNSVPLENRNIERLQDELERHEGRHTRELTDMKVDIQGIDHKGVLSKIDKIDEALRQVLDNKSAILQAQSTTTADTYIDAQQIIRTILSVTKLQLPPKLLLGKQCILDANVPIQTGITCVYLASFLGGEKVAKKVFRLGISDQKSVDKYASRFLRIAELWSKLRSDYTLPFYGIGMEPSGRNNHFQLYMVSPWMKNFDAMTYLDRYRDNSGVKKNILQIVTDAALGLQYLHNRPPVVHSGMKGALENDEDPELPVVMTGKTEAQRWMAPEMFGDGELVLTTHCDVWGWAMATLEIISGSVPYCKHRQDMNVMYKILEGPPQRKDYPKFDKYIHKPDKMWELLEKCWANEPESRPTMDEVVVALKAIARMPE
ncbi:Serine/threonine-protein kinase [Rhizoctonia solani]|uniref:Serine/threonine-protein kinase n=1 Tax=Rhizoctonia solani TaxID=456999 RepID=A0A8H8NXA2_9AGAM|nr:Serine/threonine-protein kinase [Rhizoctonia solani]QRW21095.1 Serine/threonine-protein kinase [Rhizoctonia solani]